MFAQGNNCERVGAVVVENLLRLKFHVLGWQSTPLGAKGTVGRRSNLQVWANTALNMASFLTPIYVPILILLFSDPFKALFGDQ